MSDSPKSKIKAKVVPEDPIDAFILFEAIIELRMEYQSGDINHGEGSYAPDILSDVVSKLLSRSCLSEEWFNRIRGLSFEVYSLIGDFFVEQQCHCPGSP